MRTTVRRPSAKSARSVPYASLLVARISRFRLAQAEALYSRDRRGLGRCPRPRSCVSIVRGVLGMKITHKQRPRLHAVAAQFLLGIAGVALITFVCFKIGFGVGRTSLAYVIWIALVSLLGSFGVSVVLSIVAVACLNYFFVPPLFEFRVDDPDDIVRMAAFLTTSLLVTALTTKLRASEARFRSFVDHATDGFFLFDEHQALVDVNRQACESLGYSREEMIGMHPRDFDAAWIRHRLRGSESK